jgi:chemotaxis protein CheD
MTELPETAGEVFLRPGEYHFGTRNTRVRTLLGSCVAITFWHPRLHVGGMCHFMVPNRHPAARRDGGLDGRYADEAMQMILASISSVRTGPHEYVIKMFGGASQFPDWVPASDGISLPERNVEAGLELLAAHGLTPAAQHVGGTGYRQILLELWSGDVWLKHGMRSDATTPARHREGQPA